MPTLESLAVFAVASVGLLLIPGPAVTFLVARSIGEGRAVGLATVAGLGVGSLAHVAAATLGVSAVLASSAVAFSAAKYLGAAYLIAVGLRTLLRRGDDDVDTIDAGRGPGDLHRAFGRGVLVNVLNPKTALFFLAFLPQFVDPSRGPVWSQLLALGTTFVVLGLCTDGTYAVVSSAVGDRLRARPSFRRRRRSVTGGAYLVLGAAAALGGSAEARPVPASP
ncbi:MAG TPA: LysE family translocator [Actinomycetota bacterium]